VLTCGIVGPDGNKSVRDSSSYKRPTLKLFLKPVIWHLVLTDVPLYTRRYGACGNEIEVRYALRTA
jgi:hypothetical protein